MEANAKELDEAVGVVGEVEGVGGVGLGRCLVWFGLVWFVGLVWGGD